MLRDASWYLERICDSAYIQQLPRLSGATVGQHTRQIVWRFQALNQAMRAAATEDQAILNYDSQLSYAAIETSPRVALAAIDDIINTLPKLVNNHIIWIENSSISKEETLLLPTTCERELLHLIDHTLLHFELIKIGLNVVAPCMEIPAHFGKTPLPVETPKMPVPMYRTFSVGQVNDLRVAV